MFIHFRRHGCKTARLPARILFAGSTHTCRRGGESLRVPPIWILAVSGEPARHAHTNTCATTKLRGTFRINRHLLPLELTLLCVCFSLQVAATEGFEWQSNAEDALGQPLSFSFASYAKVSAIKLKFPVGASYKFDLSVYFANDEEEQRTYLLKVGVLLCRRLLTVLCGPVRVPVLYCALLSCLHLILLR